MLPIFTVEELNNHQVIIVEQRMRPNQWSIAGFLTEQQSLHEVAVRDLKTLQERSITCDQIADKLEGLTYKWSRFSQPGHLPLAEGKYLIRKMQTRGYQTCPFTFSDKEHDDCGDRQGSADYCVTNIETEEEFRFASLMPHMIRGHHFFQGGTYRVDPEKAIAFFGLKENVSYKLKTRGYWDEVDSISGIDPEDLQIVKNSEVKRLAEGVNAYLFKGSEVSDDGKKRLRRLIPSNLEPSKNYLYITCQSERRSVDVEIAECRLQEDLTKNKSYLFCAKKTNEIIFDHNDTALPVLRVVINKEGKAVKLNKQFL